jgi:molybdopterin-containing oxidoreductase family membrane subunit
MVGLIIVNFVLIAIKFIPDAFSPGGLSYVKLMVAGSYSGLFWGLEIVIGCVIPLIILLLSRRTSGAAGWLLRISPLVVLGVYFSRYNFVIGGQSIGPSFTESLIPYVPGVADVLLFIGGIAACLLVYTLGEMLLPIEPGEKPAWFIFVKRKTPLNEVSSG